MDRDQQEALEAELRRHDLQAQAEADALIAADMAQQRYGRRRQSQSRTMLVLGAVVLAGSLATGGLGYLLGLHFLYLPAFIGGLVSVRMVIRHGLRAVMDAAANG